MHNFILLSRIIGVMVGVLASSAVDCGFELWSGQIKDYKIGIYCFDQYLMGVHKYWYL
jgi:hypothetical protein